MQLMADMRVEIDAAAELRAAEIRIEKLESRATTPAPTPRLTRTPTPTPPAPTPTQPAEADEKADFEDTDDGSESEPLPTVDISRSETPGTSAKFLQLSDRLTSLENISSPAPSAPSQNGLAEQLMKQADLITEILNHIVVFPIYSYQSVS